MGNRAEAIRQKNARRKGFYAFSEDECKYKYGGATWHAWMDGFRDGQKSRAKEAVESGESKTIADIQESNSSVPPLMAAAVLRSLRGE